MTDNQEDDTKITPVESANLVVDKFIDSASVSKVYGEPVKKGSVTIIPAAEVITGMGFGIGGDGKGDGGGGGGGYSTSRPVAVVIATEEGVRVEPVMDVTKVALAFFTALGFMLSTLAKMKKGN
ncbi:MAG TPA: spore germination protein GerW family protein [Anaerolineales bacterium]|nr:spore germination protein GerW family protein [Anaerolineales bacterium]